MPKSKLRKSGKKRITKLKQIAKDDPFWSEVMSLVEKIISVDDLSNFEIELPVVGGCYPGDGELFLVIEHCSERDVSTGDFQVCCVDQSGGKYTLTAKQWESQRVSMGNMGHYHHAMGSGKPTRAMN